MAARRPRKCQNLKVHQRRKRPMRYRRKMHDRRQEEEEVMQVMHPPLAAVRTTARRIFRNWQLPRPMLAALPLLVTVVAWPWKLQTGPHLANLWEHQHHQQHCLPGPPLPPLQVPPPSSPPEARPSPPSAVPSPSSSSTSPSTRSWSPSKRSWANRSNLSTTVCTTVPSSVPASPASSAR